MLTLALNLDPCWFKDHIAYTISKFDISMEWGLSYCWITSAVRAYAPASYFIQPDTDQLAGNIAALGHFLGACAGGGVGYCEVHRLRHSQTLALAEAPSRDGAYDPAPLMDAAAYRDFVIEIVRRTDAAPAFKVLPKRWVVERASG